MFKAVEKKLENQKTFILLLCAVMHVVGVETFNKGDK